MSQITPNSKVALTLGGITAVSGALLYAGWFGANMLRDIKDEVAGLRADIRSASTDRWTGRDMRDFASDARELNTAIQRSDGKTGLILPDVLRIQRANHNDNQ